MMWRSTAKGVFNTASKITSTIGNGVASLTFNKHYKEQRVMGRNGFLHGITSGVSGVVMDPIRGARRNGVRGALEGVGMGLAGVVTKPLSGLMDDTTRVLDSVKVAASGEKKLERLRLPRCVPCDRVLRVFDEHTAFGQSLFATATTRFLVEQESGEQYVLHCCVDGNSHYLVVTQFHALLLEPNCDLLWCVPLRGISVEEEDEEMRIILGQAVAPAAVCGEEDLFAHVRHFEEHPCCGRRRRLCSAQRTSSASWRRAVEQFGRGDT